MDNVRLSLYVEMKDFLIWYNVLGQLGILGIGMYPQVVEIRDVRVDERPVGMLLPPEKLEVMPLYSNKTPETKLEAPELEPLLQVKLSAFKDSTVSKHAHEI